MPGDDLLANIEPQPHAAGTHHPRARRAVEAVEEMGQFLRRDADTLIADRDERAPPSVQARTPISPPSGE